MHIEVVGDARTSFTWPDTAGGHKIAQLPCPVAG
jgi:hypothetical protein